MFREASFAPRSKPFLLDPERAEPRGFSFSATDTVTAVMVDANFYVKQARRIWGGQNAEDAARHLYDMALAHLNDERGRRASKLYRIFVYDAIPVPWKGQTPIGKEIVDSSQSPSLKWRNAFRDALCSMRKVILRTGEIRYTRWQLMHKSLKDLTSGNRLWQDIKDEDFYVENETSGIDIRIGIDIASLAYKRLANQIVLVSGRSDFVPAARLARQEGIDFVLDPMWTEVTKDVRRHVDGVRSVCPRIKGEDRLKGMENGNGD